MAQASVGARPFILVLAGVNGAGKSSVGGALLAEHGLTWFNPDSFARELVAQLGLGVPEANARAWEFGRSQLEAAITTGTNYAFETTLGAKTIAAMLLQAAATHDVMMIFCGLESVQLHLQRVQARVASGGHAIAEAKIRERWVSSRLNLLKLMPQLARLQVFDNSAQVAAGEDIAPPLLVMEMVRGALVYPGPGDAPALRAMPEWARPMIQAAIEHQAGPAA
ncbi:MAG: AAA family ATPase [Giesbergeria sp.]